MKRIFCLISFIYSIWLVPTYSQEALSDSDKSKQFCQGELQKEIIKLIEEDGDKILIKRFHLNNLKLALKLSLDTD